MECVMQIELPVLTTQGNPSVAIGGPPMAIGGGISLRGGFPSMENSKFSKVKISFNISSNWMLVHEIPWVDIRNLNAPKPNKMGKL